ncbi:hypothetical protein [Microcystis phage Mel-JY01]
MNNEDEQSVHDVISKMLNRIDDEMNKLNGIKTNDIRNLDFRVNLIAKEIRNLHTIVMVAFVIIAAILIVVISPELHLLNTELKELKNETNILRKSTEKK